MKMISSFKKISTNFTTIISKVYMELMNVKIGERFTCRGFLLVRNKGKISIGDSVVINSSLGSNPTTGDSKTIIIVENEANLVIGNNVGISNSVINCKKGIIIEEYTSIGCGCKIYDNDFHSIKFEDRLLEQRGIIKNVKVSPITIKKGAFVGANVMILKGVTIGCNAVIGASSVVTKDIPDNELWAGNPIKFIRKLDV
ncbi:transferase [Priestia megaterium]|nr:transferase [Priestia megaterium]